MNRRFRFLVFGLVYSVITGLLLFVNSAGIAHPVASAQGPERNRNPLPLFATRHLVSPTDMVFDSDVESSTFDSKNVSFTGHLGGANSALAVQGNYTYVGEGPRLAIVDSSNKADPVVVGKTAPLPDVVLGVKAAGNYAYVAAGWAGLRIINISDPAAPLEIGFFDTPSYVRDVDIAGSYAYLPDGGFGLRIVDISNPAAPFEVGITPSLGTWMIDVAVAGDRAYVTTEDYGFVIFDISSPSAPSELGYFLTGAEAGGVIVDGDYAYLLGSSTNLLIVDVSNPVTPTLSGSYPLGSSGSGLSKEGHYLYAADGDKLHIINVAVPAAPSAEGHFDIEDSIYAVASAGDYVYITNGGLHIIDVSDKTTPEQSSFYPLLGEVRDTALLGDFAYVASEWQGLSIVDIRYPDAPQLLAQVDTPGVAVGVFAAGDYVYIADLWGGLRIVNVSDPAAAHEVGFFATPGSYHDVAVTGDYAYIAESGPPGLRILNIGNPTIPSQVAFLSLPDSANAVSVSGSHAYVAAGSSGLRIINISSPSAPFEVGNFNTPGNAQDVTVSGDYAYVADEHGGVAIVNLADPAQPLQIGSPDTVDYAQGVDIVGKHLYVADGGYLRIVDVCDPSQPVEIGFYETIARRVTVHENAAYVAGSYAGLSILRYTGPGSITISKQADNAGETTFNFIGDMGSFSLQSGASAAFPTVPSGSYDVTESSPPGWYLHDVICDSTHVALINNGITIQLQTAEDIACTFQNRRLPVMADAGGPYAGDEGAPIALDASASSNIELIETYKWDCTNDGSWDVTSRSPSGSTCTYADDGAFTVRLRTWDIFKRSRSDLAAMTVSNVAPTVAAGTDQTTIVGSEIQFAGSFADPGTADTHIIKWDFGDGGNKWGSLTPVHTYAATGLYEVTLTITDDDGAKGSDMLSVDVLDQAPTLSGISVSPPSINEGENILLTGSMSAREADSMLFLALSWGDGMTETHEFTPSSSFFSIAHTYVDDAPSATPSDSYPIGLRLSDETGAFTTTTAVAVVDNVAPEVDAGPDRTVDVGQNTLFTAVISDPGTLDTHTISWDFGDGSVRSSGLSVSHIFNTEGSYQVTVSVEDDDGGRCLQKINVAVVEKNYILMPLVMTP